MAGMRRISGGFEFDRTMEKFKDFKRNAPIVISEESKNHFLQGFRKGGGQTDDSRSGWRERKRGAPRNSGRGILVDTGALRRSIKVFERKWSSIIIASTRIPYAQRHNEGLAGMPKREFIGASAKLNKKNKGILIKLLNKVFA